MNRVSFPLNQGNSGSAVADLQEALLELISREALINDQPPQSRQRRLLLLQREREGQSYTDTTSWLVQQFQRERGLEVSGAVDERTAGAFNRLLREIGLLTEEPHPEQPRFEVRGRVSLADGSSAVGVKVVAVDRDLRREQGLGEAQTDRSGAYRIEYSERHLLSREHGVADLVVKALDADGSILVASPVLFNAPQEAKVDLTIPIERRVPPTVFEKIQSTLEPLLRGARIDELEENPERQDLTFLSGRTGFEKPVLARFVLALRLAGLDIEPEFWFALLGGSFFGYAENASLKDNLTRISTALPSLDALTVRKALAASFSKREIPAQLRERSDEWTETFLKLAARFALGDTTSPTFARMALDDAGIDSADKQAKFTLLFNQHKALTAELLAALEKDTAFNDTQIADLRTSYQLADLTRGDFSVVRMLKDEFKIRRPEPIRTLAKQSEREWIELIERNHEAGKIRIPLRLSESTGSVRLPEAEIYAKTLEREFREAFPTTAFAGGLSRALGNGGVRGIRHAEALGRIIERHPEFSLLRTPVDDFLSKRISAEFEGLAEDKTFRLELKAVQRVFKLAPTFEAADALLADGLHSAQMIYRLGETQFVRRYANRAGFSKESARQAWSRAADTHAAVMTLIGDFMALDPATLPIVLNNVGGELAKFPNWENLFQSGDICHCEQCRSVLSPAAYFADLLMFLRDREAKPPLVSVKDLLFKRRPDLGYLELNCENANTTLPYVDVVCEVLEAVVDADGDNDLVLAGIGGISADAKTARTDVANAFKAVVTDDETKPANYGKQKIDLGDISSITHVDLTDPARDGWLVHASDATYLLTKNTAGGLFAKLLPNTKADSEQLRTYPAYVNPKAYERLRQASFPWSLPFDLFGEETRAAFKKCNVQRWDLMRTFRGPVAPCNPTDSDIAAEYFGIGCDAVATFDEKRLILGDVTASDQQAIWGETGNSEWLDTSFITAPLLPHTPRVAIVKTFLDKSGLEYDELLALLDLKFLNQGGGIFIQHLDGSCDTDKKVLQGLNGASLDRIHRFLRLWRKLAGWKMWEVDLVIRHSGIGAGALDEAFLINLFHFARLRNRLGEKATIEQLCALCGDLNTETRFTKAHEKRADGLYQTLFLNRKLIQPLDPAFEVTAVSVAEPTLKKISDQDRRAVILSVLGLSETDLDLLAGLTRASNGDRYIGEDLTLKNLSCLWRHAWLAKQLKLKAAAWKTLLKLLQQDITRQIDPQQWDPSFANPKAVLDFIEKVDQLRDMGFTPEQLNWLLAADGSERTAAEVEAAVFLKALLTELRTMRDQYDPAAGIDRLPAILTAQLQQLNRNEAEAKFFVDTLRDEVQMDRVVVAGLPDAFTDFPEAIKTDIRISYDQATKTLHFTGLMTDAQRIMLLTDASLEAVTGIPAYLHAIEEFFQTPRLALKFLDPVFTAALANLPNGLDFRTLADPALAQKISYDSEERVLRVTGILSVADKAALDKLSVNNDYLSAVNSLFTQPTVGVFPPEKLWLQDVDLIFPLRNLIPPAVDNLRHNMAVAVTKGLVYLSQNLVVRQASAKLGLTEDLTRDLLADYEIVRGILPETLLVHLTGEFAATAGVVDYAACAPTFDGWFWASRVATLCKKWKLTLAEWKQLRNLTTGAQLLDFATLPLVAGSAMAPIECVLSTARLLRLREKLPETGATLLEVLVKLDGGTYEKAEFAKDVESLNEAWTQASVLSLVDSLDPTYPNDYLRAETWERMRQAFHFGESLNGGAERVKRFAAATMTVDHAKELKNLLASKFGSDTWAVLSSEIQDTLRERKRDALTTYLLTRAKPADAPTGKWENTNDLYAYYLLDVEMSAGQLTSRLVQASGSVQLFVQRCFMGLEPNVVVKADGTGGDSAWRWWKWMRKFQVWVANRKVFLWPENWIEPELKKDRSSFFKDLENELLQNEINQDSVEKAFANYLEKLDAVAQLEIAGFYQEDNGGDAIVHVFGRTKGAEPHIYYYRRYDYRQWTPWEKVDLDIQGDYLVPAVINNRLFLCWPVFTEVPDEVENSKDIPIPGKDDTSAKLKPASKKLKLQLAVSDYRQGKWTPKRTSKDFDLSDPYTTEIVKANYNFFPVDRSLIDGHFYIRYYGYSVDRDNYPTASLGCGEDKNLGRAFEVSGCRGVPQLDSFSGMFKHAIRPERSATGDDTKFLKWEELPVRTDVGNDLALEPSSLDFGDSATSLTQLLEQTPGIFRVSPPGHLSYFDQCLYDGWWAWVSILKMAGNSYGDRVEVPTGSWLPFFYNDQRRTFFVLPSLWTGKPYVIMDTESQGTLRYYPEIKGIVSNAEKSFSDLIKELVDDFKLETLNATARSDLGALFNKVIPSEMLPPFDDEEWRERCIQFFMKGVHLYLGGLSLLKFQSAQFHFKNFYHPFICDFAKLVHNPLEGVPGLMKRETQLLDNLNNGFSFKRIYQPTSQVVDWASEKCYPREVVDFDPDGAYSSYNWEIFFHAPLLIANSLSRNQRFEEARDWYHFIFNPIGVESLVDGGSVMSKYWITKPFFEMTDEKYKQQRIDNILRMLSEENGNPNSLQTELDKQVEDWRKNPFEPHRIANYRTVAYQKTVVMKYLDNLIAWGDYLFRQDSMESINEATQLYILAAEILGPKPKKIPPQVKPPLESFNELEERLDDFANALVQVENLIPAPSGTGGQGAESPPLPTLYFCIPHNEMMLGYWDTVSDRLYKIRHCMNIEGVVRQLALFEPPIDPGALVKAVAGGVDVAAALADLNAPLPLYRFNVLLQKANEVCNDVKALGSALLSALEKKDAEALALLRQGQEIRLLEAVTNVREKQIEEAKANWDGVIKNEELITIRRDYYRDIEKVSFGEDLSTTLNKLGIVSEIVATTLNATAGTSHFLPEVNVGVSGLGTPVATAKFGGRNVGDSAFNWAAFFSGLGGILHSEANILATQAGYERRWDDWKLQERLANKELDQIKKSIAAAELRFNIATKERDNHLIQIENAKSTDEFMRSKYTSQELYQWQVGQISGVYFQSYKLAYDLAKRAERCLRFELGLQDSSYIQFGYWDSLKKGLLSGEKLQYDLRRLESAYLEQNRREFELTKHVSLLQLDPLALVQLRETGRCFFRMPEELFDLDYPGHYFRRIKTVSLTLPCVAGPYTTISCTLRLLKNSVRINTNNGTNGYARNAEEGVPADDTRFVENNVPVKAIAASSGQNDSGVFELGFRDERYLPFEGAGAISEWSIELFSDFSATDKDFGRPLRQFDYGSIYDAILHVRYTAREDTGVFKNNANTHLRKYPDTDMPVPLFLALDLRRDFGAAWSRFLNPAIPANGNVFELEMSTALFPHRDAAKTLKINTFVLLARCSDPLSEEDYEVTLTPPLPEAPPPPEPSPPLSIPMSLSPSDTYGGLHFSQKDVSAAGIKIVPTDPPLCWKVKVSRKEGGNPIEDPVKKVMELEDLVLVLGYGYEWK